MQNLTNNSLYKKLITTIIILSISLTSINSIFAADDAFGPDYPGKDEAMARFNESFLKYKRGLQKDNETMVNLFQSDASIKIDADKYMIDVQDRIYKFNESRKQFNAFLAYFESMDLAGKEYETLQTKIDSIEKLPIGDLDKLDKNSLRRFVLLTVDKQLLSQYIQNSFPLYWKIYEIKHSL